MAELNRGDVELIKQRSREILTMHAEIKGNSEHEKAAFDLLTQSLSTLVNLNSSRLGPHQDASYKDQILLALARVNPKSPNHIDLMPVLYRETKTAQSIYDCIGPRFSRALTRVEAAVAQRVEEQDAEEGRGSLLNRLFGADDAAKRKPSSVSR